MRIVGPGRRWWKVGIEPSGRQGWRRQPRPHTRRRSWQRRPPPRRRRHSRSSRRRRAAIEVPSRWSGRSSAISHHRPSRRRRTCTHRRPTPSRRTHAHAHAHSRPSARRGAHPAHIPRTTHPTTRRGRGRKARPDPRPLPRLVVDVELGPGHLVVLLPPSRRQGRHFGVGADEGLLGRRQPHWSGAPLVEILLVVQLEVLPELPSPALLLPSRGGVMGQVRVGIVVKEARHYFQWHKRRRYEIGS